MSNQINNELTEELYHIIHNETLYKDGKGYYILAWYDWEGGAGSYCKEYLDDKLQETAAMLNVPYKSRAVHV